MRVTAWSVGGRCRISVIDDGVGVAPEDVDRIFSRFDRGSAPGRSGTGLGLGPAIVRDLARAMGGDAGYTAAAPRGAEFWVDLPEPITAAEGEPVAVA